MVGEILKRYLFLSLFIILFLLPACTTGQNEQGKNNIQSEVESSSIALEDAKAYQLKEIKRDVFYWNLAHEPLALDPINASDFAAANIINQTFEGLVRVQEDNILPAIAKSWEYSEDGLKLTFHLRESQWSDGSPLTANDFVYAWKRAINPKNNATTAYLWQYSNIRGVSQILRGEMDLNQLGARAIDDYTIEIELERQTDYLLSLFANAAFMPVKKEIVESSTDDSWAKNPATAISNGAYSLADYQAGISLQLKKNTHYWHAVDTNIKMINVEFVEDVEKAYFYFENGALQLIQRVPISEVMRLIAEETNFSIFDAQLTAYCGFNFNKEIFKDINIRKALNLGLDRQKMVEELALEQMPASALVAPRLQDSNGNQFYQTAGDYGIKQGAQGITEAQSLLTEAGYDKGKDFPELRLLYLKDNNQQFLAKQISSQYKKNLGIKLTLVEKTADEFTLALKQGDYDLVVLNTRLQFADPLSMLAVFSSDSLFNYIDYKNDDYDNYLDIAAKSSGAEHYDALYQAQYLLMSDFALIPLYYDTDYTLVSERLSGWTRSRFGLLDFSEAELQPLE